MKLKKLEVCGFKSFVDKAAITFPSGVSAIVGPNGCGKSNVVDAMRWVMGEQSVKQLRGKSMEDVIFSGTDGKHPLNMAEVSLTLINNNGTVPEEFKNFSEIMVTRRLFRSGESGYFINKQPCRLKDIHNLFMGSGMGARTYAVIQQGNIGAITDAGPDERRLFIEEAAGVIRYKNRKNEALRKVQSTQQNLLRVLDIIAEVKRQMGGLKRQARAAERYKHYQQQIRELDVLLNLERHDAFRKEIEEAENLLLNLKDSDLAHASQLKQLDAAVEEIKLRRSRKNQEISEQKALKFDFQRQMDRLENDLAHLKDDIRRLGEESKELDTAKSDIEEKNSQLATEIAEVETENVEIQSRISELKQTIEKERQSSEQVRNKLTELNQELEKAKNELMDLVAQEARYNNIYQNASNNRENLKRRLNRTGEERVLAGEKVDALQARVASTDRMYREHKTGLSDVETEINDLQQKLSERSRTLSEKIRQAQTLELEQKGLRSKHAALKKMEDDFEWYREGVQSIMKQVTGHGAVDSDEFELNKEGIVGILADMLETEPSYETAVEAVLGESLQYILVDNPDIGYGAIDYLRQTTSGWSGFIPLADVKPLQRGSMREPDALKRLLNHVSIKPGYEQIAEALLGHVVVADDFNEAREIWNNNGSFQSIVTLDGDVITHQGMLCGGSRKSMQGILTQKNEIRLLQKQIEDLSGQIQEARKTQEELENEVRIYETDLQKLIERKNEISLEVIEAEKALYRETEDLKNAKRHLEIIQLEQEQLIGEESDIDDELTRYKALIGQIENRVQTAQKTVAQTTEEISKVSEQMEVCNQNIVDLKLKLTSLDASFESSSNTLKRLNDFKEDSLIRHQKIVHEIEHKKRKQVELSEKERRHRTDLDDSYQKIQALEAALETNESSYQAIDQKLQENDGTMSEIRIQREEILQKIRLLEIEQSQRRIKQENIANRLEENYGKSHEALRAEFYQETDIAERLSSLSHFEREEKLDKLRRRIERIGDVNLGAIREFDELKTRHDFLTEQHDDLVKAIEDLHKVIRKINRITQERFMDTFNKINEKLSEVFPRLFEGGTAKLILTDPDKPLETGVEFMIHPPGKKLTRMSLLSGGEKALSAIAFIFSIFLIKPASFCLMDEIDAPLDDVNVTRFNELLKLIGEQSQIIMVTHNKRSMEFADVLFGITMEQKGISKIVSVNLEHVGN